MTRRNAPSAPREPTNPITNRRECARLSKGARDRTVRYGSARPPSRPVPRRRSSPGFSAAPKPSPTPFARLSNRSDRVASFSRPRDGACGISRRGGKPRMNRAERRRLAKQRETRKGAPGRDAGARLVEIMRRGIESYQAGRLAEAEQSFRTFLESIPDDADAHHLLGVVLYRAGRHQDAVAHIRKSIDFAPENASFHNNLGNVLNDLGRTDEAFDCFSRAVAIDPGLAEAHNNLGNLLKDRARGRGDSPLRARTRAEPRICGSPQQPRQPDRRRRAA